MCLFSLQVTKNGIWKALMPSIRIHPEGTIYGKKNLLWILWAASSSYELPALPPPPLPYMLQLPPRFLLLPTAKVMCNMDFIFVLINF
jgi:hypothetical protein